MESKLTPFAPTQAANHGDHPPSILGVLERDDFLQAVQRAAADARAAREICDTMQLWADRLQPYFNTDPRLTIADALRLYQTAQASAAAPGDEQNGRLDRDEQSRRLDRIQE